MKSGSLRAVTRVEEDPPITVADWLRHRAVHEPARQAFMFLGERADDARNITYLELDRRARAIAAALRVAGASGERALLLHPPGLDYIAALYACFYAGVTAVPAYPPRAGRGLLRLRSIAEDAGARFALTTSSALERARPLIAREAALTTLHFLCTDLAGGSADANEVQSDPAELSLLQYTSGSTSAPKGVMLTQRHFSDNIEQIVARRGASSDDRIVLWLPPYHDMGLIMGILLPVRLGARSILMSPSSFLQRPSRWLEAMTRHRGTVSGSPNFGYELCVRRLAAERRAAYDLRSWRCAFNGAERVNPETLTRFADAFAPAGFDPEAFAPCYGLAEATLGAAFGAGPSANAIQAFDAGALFAGRAEAARDGRPARTLVSCGRPLNEIDLRIVDPATQRERQPRTVGEIWLRGPNVADGYYGKPDLSRAVFGAQLAGTASSESAGYLRTGDLGFVADEELFVVGRLKDLIIIDGVNYYPEDIEAVAAEALPGLEGGVAAFSSDGPSGEQVVIAIELDPRKHPGVDVASAVRRAVAAALELPVHDVVLVRRGSLPKTSSGKLQRGQCRARYLEHGFELVARASPSTSAEPAAPQPSALIEPLRTILAELLGVASIGADDDLFVCGGHSLIATQLVSRVRQQLGIDLELRTVFEAPTARELAARLHELPRVSAPQAIPRVDRRGRLALSSSQERMWFQQQLEPEGAAYNVSGAVELSGPLDVAALRAALEALLARHEILRSNYPSENGEARIAIAEHVQLTLIEADLAAEPEPERAALARVSQLASQAFDVAREPLFRIALYRVGRERHVLGVSMHHLVTDAWSMGLLVADLQRLYRELRAHAPLPPLPEDEAGVGYIDYASFQRTAYDQARLARDLEYWKRQLDGVTPLELPLDRPRPQHFTSRGALEPLVLAPELLEALRSFGASQGATLFMVMLGAFELLLYRYTQQCDLVVGVPIANRTQLQAEAFIGTLVNTLPFRLRIDPDQSFSTLLSELREISLEAYAHQDLPFERLVAELPIERELGRSPLIQVMFDFQNAPMRLQKDAELGLRPLIIERGAAQFDLSLLILDTDLGKTAGLEYRTDLFDAGTIRRMLGHYVNILAAVVADPERAIAAIPLLSVSERYHTLATGRSARARPGVLPSLPALFAASVARTPDAPAVRDVDTTLSYRQLDARASALASRLRALGAGPGERVALCLERSHEVVIALLAVLKCGAAYVPLDPRYPSARLQLILEDSDPRLVITEPQIAADLPSGFAARALDAANGAPAANPAAFELPDDPKRAAYVLYTSGSTGRPKGVEVSIGALSNFLLSMAREPGMVAGERLLSVTTIAFDIAGLELFLPLITSASVYVAPAEVAADGQRLARCIASERPTLMQATPATWRMLIESGWKGEPGLRILCGGETLPRDLADALLERAQGVWNMYGPTETTIWSTFARVTRGSGPLPIGRPIDATSVYVLDERGQLLPLGIPGELCIGGAGVANGYFRQADLSAERFLPDAFAGAKGARLYRTGDRGRLCADGTIYCLGRLDHQIKIRGHRVEPAEIEAAIKDEFGFSDAVVVASEDRPGDVRLIAYYLRSGAEKVTLGALHEKLRKRLPDYMLPSVFVALERLPQTPNGKLDRKALPRPDLSDEVASEYEAPRDPLERELVRMWEGVLARGPIGIRDNFFRLGGHSLLAVRLFARIEREFDVEMPLAVVLEAPTLADLADAIRTAQGTLPEEAERGDAGFTHLVSLRSGDDRAPLFCVHGAGGNVLNLHPLARHLGGTRPFYGLTAAGVDGIGPPATSIEAMAEAYLREVRAVVKTGPYHLAGYCGGGLVAFEMARMLVAAGERVGLLALIDCYRPGIDTRIQRYGQMLDGVLRQGVRYLAARAQVWFERNRSAIARNAAIEYHRLQGERMPLKLRDYWLTMNFFGLAGAYQPQAYAGRLTLLYAANRDPLLAGVGPDLGWTELVNGTLEAHEVPGDHETLAKEPHVRTLAAKLRAALDAAEERARSVHPGGRAAQR